MKMVPISIIFICLARHAMALQPQQGGYADGNGFVTGGADDAEEDNIDQSHNASHNESHNESRPLFNWVKGLLSKNHNKSRKAGHSEREAMAKMAALAKEASLKAEAEFREWYKKGEAGNKTAEPSPWYKGNDTANHPHRHGKKQEDKKAQATGDPHMSNIRGQHFDLAQPGEHALIVIPRFANLAEETLLRVRADVRRVGLTCEDIYIKTLNVTGMWVEAARMDRLSFHAGVGNKNFGKWWYFGKVQLKVVNGVTQKGTTYLNFFVRNLGHTGLAIGGLLGEDDHTAAATMDKRCTRTLAFLADASEEAKKDSRSSAEASLMQMT